MGQIVDLEKKRAKYAFSFVEIVVKDMYNKNIYKDKKAVKKDEYKSYVKKIPTLIQTNGLSAAFAFMYSKKKSYQIIYDQIDSWLKEINMKEDSEELVKWMINLDSKKYRFVTSEVLSILNWMRRFAEGMIEKEKDGKEKEKTTS